MRRKRINVRVGEKTTDDVKVDSHQSQIRQFTHTAV